MSSTELRRRPRSKAKQKIKIITLNIRFDGQASLPIPITDGHINPCPKVEYKNERPWSERRTRLLDALCVHEADFLGFQEVLNTQIDDLQTLLGSGYAYIGVGREDGKKHGEYSPIFWKKERFELVAWTTKWLSPTPDVVGSKGWDASQCRIATFATLRCKTSNELQHFICTHYDDQGKEARAKSSILIRKLAKDWVHKQGEGLVVLMGDLNSPPDQDGYQNMISLSTPPSSNGLRFIDSRDHLVTRSMKKLEERSQWRQTGPYGPIGTYTDWHWGGTSLNSTREKDERIDFIFLATRTEIRPGVDVGAEDEEQCLVRGDWEVAKYVVIDNLVPGTTLNDSWKARWSDHRAVLVELEAGSETMMTLST